QRGVGVTLPRARSQIVSTLFCAGRARVPRDGLWALEQLIEHGWTSVRNRGCQPKGVQNLCVVNFAQALHIGVDGTRRNISAENTYPRKCFIKHFIGFTYICGRCRAGSFHLKRKTRRNRMRTRLREIKVELRRRMHEPVPWQGQWLTRMVRRYFAYHSVPTNRQPMNAFRCHVMKPWHRTLRRRSQKDFTSWERIRKLAADYLPPCRTSCRSGSRHPVQQTSAVHPGS